MSAVERKIVSVPRTKDRSAPNISRSRYTAPLDKSMKVAIASDHAGFHYKERIKLWLEAHDIPYSDFGTHSDEPADYPTFIIPAAVAVANGEYDRGIVLGGSGNGEAMAANRVARARCALCWSEEVATLARRHNDANMVSIGARVTPFEIVEKILERFFSEPFDGGRHERRIRLLETGGKD